MRSVVEAAEAAAFERYTLALGSLALTPGCQFDLALHADTYRLVREWRAIWHACLRELGLYDASAAFASRLVDGSESRRCGPGVQS